MTTTDRSPEAELLVEKLISILGERAVVSGSDAALVDTRKIFRADPIAIVKPASTEEVAAVVRACAAAGVAVVTSGGNTGLSGAAVPQPDVPSVVVSLLRMNAIESVNAERSTVTTQAGVTIQALQEAANQANRLFAPDWGARGSATIGGGIATDAGGNNVLRYGNMRDQVMGLEVVFADGRIWDGLRSLRKDSSGYDLKHLFVGSEGTLGIVTRAVLKLHPATPYAQSALASLTSLDGLLEFFELAGTVAPNIVTAFELMPEVGINRVCEVFDLPHPLSEREDFYVLVKLASSAPVTDALTDLLSQAAEAGLISDGIVAATAEQEARLWLIRDELPPTNLYKHDTVGLKLDTAVPLDHIREFHDTVHRIAAEVVPDALTYGFGHVGDGNMHMMVLPIRDEDVAHFKTHKPELQHRIDQATFALRGTLSAEHGIGQDLRDRVADQKPDIEWEMMHAIKTTLDPQNTMNPGKVLPARRAG